MANLVPISTSADDPTGMALYRLANQIANKDEGRDPNSVGVYSALPTCTPKYLRHRIGRHHEYEGTMARMLLSLPANTFADMRNELDDEVTRMIADVLANDGVEGGFGYIDFLMNQATHPIQEKVQISESMADDYVAFFFGHSPQVFNYTGVLMNTYQDDWAMRMFRLFRDLGRGTQLARRKAVLHLKYDSMIVSGSMLNIQWAHRGDRETADDFSFSFLVKRISILYGGLAPPTAIENISTIDPTDVIALSTAVDQEAVATLSYAQGPTAGATPEGVSDAALDAALADGQEVLDTGGLDQPLF